MGKWKDVAEFIAAIVLVFTAFSGALWAFSVRVEEDIWTRIERRGTAIKEEIREMIELHEDRYHGGD